MVKYDKELCFLLRYENIAWYEDGAVRILDRRVFPFEKKYVVCKKYTEVAEAISAMVTQSGGPYTAAAMGMVLAAYECRNMTNSEQLKFLDKAAHVLSHARPTTISKMQVITEKALNIAKNALFHELDPIDELFNNAIEELNSKYDRISKNGEYLASLFPDNGIIMTMCFGEVIIGMMLLACKKLGKNVKFICPETRPYLQGSRLTASCIHEMGFDVTVITDNMPGYVIKAKKVDVFTSASDIITLDGHIINKIGTFQVALAAHYWEIPYYVTGTPSEYHRTTEYVEIEERDPSYVLEILGNKTAEKGIKGYYPAFDITPPCYCSGVVTDKGIFSPYNLNSYFNRSSIICDI